MKWLDEFPLWLLFLLALGLALAPFAPEPHLWQKLKMLSQGVLRAPIDIFDLLMHASGIVLLVLKLARIVRAKSVSSSD